MVAIGVTAHRVLTDLDKIVTGVDGALAQVERVFAGQPFTLVSSLAEGGDRLVVPQVLARPRALLVVPLPLPKADYMGDFVSAEARAEFLHLLRLATHVVELPPRPTREEAYESAGLFMLDHSDLLLTICGLGRTGARLAKAFQERGNQVVGIDLDAENDLLQPCRDHGVRVLIGDATDPDVLRRAGSTRPATCSPSVATTARMSKLRCTPGL
jgi:TrkA-N domain